MTDEETYKCERCGKEFESKQGLGSHKAWHRKKDKQELPNEIQQEGDVNLKVVE